MTSIAVSTSLNSLVQLGVSISDVATVWSWGNKFGSFITTSILEKDFLKVLDTDDATIFERTGLFDALAWDKRWTRELNILGSHGKQETFTDGLAQSVYEKDPTRFTRIMISVVTVLLTVTTRACLRRVVSTFLKAMLQTIATNEVFVDSQYNTLLQAWTSSGFARGMSMFCSQTHHDLVQQQIIQPGVFPVHECDEVADFL